MANAHPYAGDEYSDKIYFDSSLPGSVIYHAEEALDWKTNTHPAVRAFNLRAYNWALNGEDVPEQKAQFRYQLQEKQQLFGQLARRRGDFYYGPQAPVIADRLRPRNAKPLAVVHDN